MTRIKDDAFRDNTMITGVTIPGCIVSIGDRAFAGCANLGDLTMLEGVRAIGGSDAFRWCPKLKTVTLPKSLTFIRQRAFGNDPGIERVNVHSIEHWLSIGFGTGSSSPLCSPANACLYVCNAPVVDLKIPVDITRINGSCFNGAGTFKSIFIPSSVRWIGGCAFDNLSSSTVVQFSADIGEVEMSRYVCGNNGSPTIKVEARVGRAFSCWVDKDGNKVEDPFHSPKPVVVMPKWDIAERGNDPQPQDSRRTSPSEHDSRKKETNATSRKRNESSHKIVANKNVRSSRDLFKIVKDKLVIVECNDSCGSGFIMTMEDGKKFFITNKHVVQGQKSVVARLLNGKKLPLGAFAVASNRDLVRFTLPDDVAALLLNSDEPNMGDSVYIFGNSDGSGVVTDLCGDVVGIGPEKIEVSAKFIHGNSGSAVFNDRGEVIGVATFATYDPNPEDWIKRDTRFSNNVRRFAVRFAGVKWRSVRYTDFYNECIAEARKRLEEGLVVPQVSASFSSPKCYVDRGPKITMGGYRPLVIKSGITVSLSGGGGSIKTPIIRACVLIKDDSGYHMRDCILTRIGSATGRSSPPVYAYGNNAEGIYHTDGLKGVYFLEGLSYWNGLFPGKARSGIKYFDRTKTGECLFTCCTDGRPPEIICFRFECWQNGALAGVYNSRSVTFLRSKGIPLDWYIRAKYPDKFDYSAINYPAGNR